PPPPPGTTPRAAPAQTPPAPRAWSAYTGVSNVYDSNIDHSQLGPESYGLLVVVGGQYRQRSSGTTVELQYDGVFRRYTNTNIWNRPGHSATVSFAQRVARPSAMGAAGESEVDACAKDARARRRGGGAWAPRKS